MNAFVLLGIVCVLASCHQAHALHVDTDAYEAFENTFVENDYPYEGDCRWKLKKMDGSYKMMHALLCDQQFIRYAENITHIPEVTQILNLSRNPMFDGTELKRILSPLTNLTILHINKNDFRYFPQDMLANNQKLEEFEADQNFLNSIPNDLFKTNVELKHVSIFGNRIQYLPAGLFENARKLQTLNVRMNNIPIIAYEFFRCIPKIKEIDFSFNILSNFPPNLLNGLTRLEKAYFSSNRIELLRFNLFADTTRIKSIHLQDNKLTAIPSGLFSTCEKLEHVDLSKNQLQILPIDLFAKNINIKRVNLKKNQLVSISNNMFKNCPNLQEVDLSENEIKRLGKGLFQHNKQLEFVDISSNLINYRLNFTGVESNVVTKITSSSKKPNIKKERIFPFKRVSNP